MLIGYARVCAADPILARQLEALHSAGCARVFTDEAVGVTGGGEGRAVLRELLSELRAGDVLVVSRLDRLGCTVRQLVTFVERELRMREAGLRSLAEGIDTTTSSGELFYTVMVALAALERDLARERAGAGLAIARARGRSGGRRPKLTSTQIAAAREQLSGAGASMAAVAASLGVARSTLWRALGRSALAPSTSACAATPTPITAQPLGVDPLLPAPTA